MKPEVCSHRFPGHIALGLQPFEAACGPSAALRMHSSPPSHELSASHSQVAQRKQRDELRRILGQALVANIGEAELALDDSEGVFHLGANTGLELFRLLDQLTPRRKLLRHALAKPQATCQSTPVASGRLEPPPSSPHRHTPPLLAHATNYVPA